MFDDEFYEMIDTVEKSFEGFKIWKNGSFKDKLFLVLSILCFICSSFFLFYSYVCSAKIFLMFISMGLFFACSFALFEFQTFIKRRENFIYYKGQSKEDEFRNAFLQRLSKNNIDESQYVILIEYYENKINKEQMYRYNEVCKYCTVFLIPIIISCFSNCNKLFEILKLSIIGLIIIPVAYLIISLIKDRKLNKYKSIVYYLRLTLTINNYKELKKSLVKNCKNL